MTAESSKPGLPDSPELALRIRAALRTEVAARGSKGAFIYPIVSAVVVATSDIGREHRAVGALFVGLLAALAIARTSLTRWASLERARRALVVCITLQSTCWGCCVAVIFQWYGLAAVTWLALIVTAGFAAGGTSSMGIDASVHRPFLAGLGVPILTSAIATSTDASFILVLLALLYYWFLLRDARQHAEAFEVLLRAQDELRLARDQAFAADQAKSAFLAMMSHEIRTPMHAAVGTASMLLETTLDDRQRRYAQTIVRAGESLVELINDVLDISRMDAQGIQLEQSDFELKPALFEIIHMFEPLARRAALDFHHELDDSTDSYLSGDRRRLQQILVNLIGNAIKFTERGSVTLQAHARELSSGFEVTLVVRDTGIGIEPVQLERVFQPFEQADSGIARKYGGSGLGLAICKRLAVAMGGRIEVASHLGRGTSFTTVVMLSAATQPRADSAEHTSVNAGGAALHTGTRVLVVDDSALNREMAQEMLEQLGCRVATASSGAEGIAMARSEEFDIVLMDCQMHGLDGYATTRQLRALELPIARVPIVAVTANAFDDDRKRVIEAGMNDLLAKPFGLRELQRTLGRWVANVDAVTLTLPAVGPRSLSSSLYPRAIEHISAMLAGASNEVVIDRVVEAFLQQWPQRLSSLASALRDGDAQGVREVVHTLDGAVPYFGVEALNAALRRLQQHARAGDIAGARAVLPDLEALIAELAASRARHRVSSSA